MARWWLLLLLLLAPGCVERKLIVKSDPPGAAVYVDGELKGVTTSAGLVVPFESYGTRTVLVRLEGHTPRRREVELAVPWYQIFPLGLFADLLWPGTIVDEHPVTIVLERRGPPRSAKEIAEEAEHFADTEERRP